MADDQRPAIECLTLSRREVCALLPEDVRARYAELQGRRRGAYVLDRDLVQAVVAFVSSVGRPRPVKASLEPDSAGSLVPQRQRQEERSVA